MAVTRFKGPQDLMDATTAHVDGLLSRPRAIPTIIVGATLLLLTLGLLMVWSSSAIFSIQQSGSSFATVSKQGMFAVIGVAILVFTSRLPVKTIRMAVWPMLGIVLALLVLVLIPGIGIEVAGQRNWIGIGGTFRVQPSEIAKLTLIVWGAEVLSRRYREVTDWHRLLVPVVPVGLLLIVLVLLEGDFGNAMILAVILAALLFAAGAPMRLFAIMGAISLVGIAGLAWMAPYRVERFTSFLNHEADRLEGAWQVTQGMYALGSGGFFGVGLGASREKWGTLPAAHTDFIFPVVGEELGLVGTLSVLLLFGLLVFAILRLVQMTDNRFIQLVSAGMAGWLIIQFITNVGATLKLLPITGVTLPFLSYGGSSLIFILAGIGVMLALSREVISGPPRPRPSVAKVRDQQLAGRAK